MVERRLEEITSPKHVLAEVVSQESHATLKPGELLRPGQVSDLLPLVNPKRDSLTGFWERNGDVLVTAKRKKNSTVLLPATVEGDYRLETQFTRLAGEDAVAIIIPVDGNPCLLTFSDSANKASCLTIEGKQSRAERGSRIRVEPGTLSNNRKHAVSILVRLRGYLATIQVSLDGEPYFNWSGSPKAVSAADWPAPPANQFALGANELVVFHNVASTAHLGEGRAVGPRDENGLPTNAPGSRDDGRRGGVTENFRAIIFPFGEHHGPHCRPKPSLGGDATVNRGRAENDISEGCR